MSYTRTAHQLTILLTVRVKKIDEKDPPMGREDHDQIHLLRMIYTAKNRR
jgi:hypothetical protein